MSSKEQKIIIFQYPECNVEIYNELTEHGWNVNVANNLQQAADLLNKHVFNVGLCLFDGKCNYYPEYCVDQGCLSSKCIRSQQLAQANQLFSLQSGINWIMGLPEEFTPYEFPY